MARILPNAADSVLIVESDKHRSQLFEDTKRHAEESQFLMEEQLVPELQSCIEGQAATEEGE